LDDLDDKLLHLLTRNARSTATDLASVLGVSRGTVQNRIEQNTITKSVPLP